MESLLGRRELAVAQWWDKETEGRAPPSPNNETETVIYNLTNKSLRSDGFTGEFYQTFREELTPLSLKHLQKLPRKTHSQTHSMKLPSTWYQIQAKIPHTQKDNYRSISLMNIDAKICNKILANRIQWYIKRIICHDKVVSWDARYPRDARICQYPQINCLIHYTNILKNKDHMIISTDDQKKLLTKFNTQSW